MKRTNFGIKWTCAIGLVLLFAMVATTVLAQSKSRGGSPGVRLTLVSNGTYDSTVDVTICGDSLCTAKKSAVCPTLTATVPGYTAPETCGNGGGWKGYEYTITVNGSQCAGMEPVGALPPRCIINGESADLSAQ